jgi:chromosome segregation ATPase
MGLLLYVPLAHSAPASFVYQGQIIKPNGHTLEANNVKFTVEVISPGIEECTLFREQHTINMMGSNGIFAIEVGDGVRVGASYADSATLASALNNSIGNLTGLTCMSGSSYEPTSGDFRKLRITFDDGSGPNTLAQDHRIVSVPFAQSAASVDGKLGDDLIVRNQDSNFVLTQDNLESIFTDTNYPELMALLNGTSTTYLSSMPAANFSMNSNRITDLDSPVDPNDATNKNYVDSTIGGLTADPSIASLSVAETGQVLTWNGTQWETSEIVMEDTTKLPLAGGTMTGAIDMGNQNITNANQISLNGDLNADGNANILGDALVSGGIGVATGINSDGDISIHDLQALQLGNDIYGSSNYVGFRAPTVIPVDVIWTLPGSDGDIGQVLSTNGSGELSWVDPVDIMGTPALGGLVDNADYIMIYDVSEGELRRATRAELVLTEAEVDAYVANNGYASDADLGTLEGRVTTNEGNITSLDTRVGTAEGNITGLQGDVAGVQTDVANLDTRVTAAEGEITTIDGRVTTNETDITNLTTRVTDAEGEITAIDGRVSTNETDITNLDTRVTANEGAVTALDGRMTTAEGNISTLQTQVGNLDTDLSAVQTDLATAQTDITNLTTRVTDNEGDISTLQGQMTTANTNISDLDGRVTVNEGAITALDTNKVNRAGDTMSGDLTLADREVRFTSGGANFVGLRAPAGLSADQVWTLPDADGVLGQVLETDGAGALRWRTLDAVGESNTASNIGTGGVGVYVDKDGVDLRFRNISAASNKVTVTANANNIDVDVDESNLDASLITNVPSGNIDATDIQGAIDELDTEKVAKSGDTMTGDLTLATNNALILGDSGSNYVGFVAPATVSASQIWTLPESDGSANQVLQTNGLGVLSWVDQAEFTPTAGDYTASDITFDPSALSVTSIDVQGAVGELDGRMVTAEGNITSIQGDVTTAQTDITNLTTRVTDAEADIIAIDSRVTTNETDITNLTTRVTDAENDIVAIDGRVSANETDITNLDTRVTANEGAVTALDGRMTSAEGNISALQTQVGNLDTDLSAVQTDLATAQTDITNLTTRVTDNEGDISTLQGQMTTANTNISDLDGRVTVNEGAITALDTNKVNRAGDTMSGDLTLADREVRFTSGGANFVGLRAPAGLSADQVWTLPDADGVLGQVLETDGAGALRWRTLDAVGESNTASNIGTGGVGVYVDKDGVDLRFRNISAASNKVTVTANANNIDVDVDESNLDASLITNVPSGNIDATDIQGAIDELDTEKVAKSGDTMTGDLTLATNNALILGDSGSNYVGFVAPATVSASQIWTLPESDGSANQVLQTNGLGVLSWVDQAEFTPTAGDYTASDITFDPSALSVTSIDVQGAVGELDGRMVTAEGNITSIQGDVTTAQTDITNLTTRVTDAEADIIAIDSRVTTNETDITNLTTRVTDAENDIVAIDGRVSANETDITNLDTRVTANEGAVTALDGRMTSAEGNISALQTQVGNLDTDLSAVQTDLATAQTDITNLTTRVTDNEGDISTLQGQMTTANTNISDLDGRVTANEGAITALDTNKVNRAGDTMSGNLTLADREVRFTSGGANFVGLRAPAGLSADQVWTLPGEDGSVGQVLETDGAGALRWRSLDSVGESNTASNIGTGGVGVFVDKDGVDLRFRNISAASNKVTVTANANNIDVDVDESNLDASLITNVPAGDIEATDIQDAINELDTEKVAKSGDTMTGDLTLATNNALILGDSGANYVGFVAPATVSASQIWTLPTADGAANQVLQTNGSGVLSWVDQADFTPTAGDYTASDITFDPSALSVTSTNVQGAVGELDGRIVIAEGNITSLQGDVTTAQTDITNLTNRVTDAETDITALDGRVGANETAISDLDTRVTANEGNITANEGAITALDGRMTTAEGSISALQAQVGDTDLNAVQTDLAAAQTNITNLTTRVTDNEGDISTLQGQMTTANTNISALDSRVTANEGAITALDTNKVNRAGDTMTGDLTLDDREIRLTSGGANFVGLRAPAGLSGNQVWTLPAADGDADQVLQTNGAGGLSWVDLPAGGSDVTTVFGRDGAVVAQSGDYNASQITNTPAGDIAANNVQDAINELDDEKVSKSGDTMTGPLTMNSSAIIDNNNELRFSDAGANYVAFRAPVGLGASTLWTLPSADGTSGQVLQTNGAGVLSWVDPSGGGGDNLGDHVATQALDMNGYAIGSLANGNASNPSLSFDGAGTTGFYGGSGTISVTNAGVHAADINNTAWSIFRKVRAWNGEESLPEFSFTGDTGKGMYHAGAGVLGFSVGGVQRLRLDNNGKLSIGNTAPNFNLTVGNGSSTDGSIMAQGYGTVGTSGETLTVSGAGRRMFWYARKGAFRAGGVTDDSFNDANIGNYSTAFGLNSRASGVSSFAIGGGKAYGNHSIVLGESMVNDLWPDGTKSASVAIGDRVWVYGQNATGLGSEIDVYGHRSMALGRRVKTGTNYNTNTGVNSLAISAGEATGAWPEVSGNESIGIFIGNQGGQTITANNVMAILGGNVGIGVNSPTSTLEVNGQVRNSSSISNASATINFASGNLQYTSDNCGTFNLHNLKDGGVYNFAVKGPNSATCTFNAFSDAGSTSLDVHMPKGHGATIEGQHTIYSIMVMGGDAYVSWVNEFD